MSASMEKGSQRALRAHYRKPTKRRRSIAIPCNLSCFPSYRRLNHAVSVEVHFSMLNERGKVVSGSLVLTGEQASDLHAALGESLEWGERQIRENAQSGQGNKSW